METGNNIIIAPQAKSAVIIRQEMARTPAVMQALEPLEKSVFLASTGKPISDYSGTELGYELQQALTWISKDIGYRAKDANEMQYLVIRTVEILKRYYSNLTLKDFRMAFEMCITGELDDYLPKGRDGQPDRNHYQLFNAEYICKVLNAYRSRRAYVMKKANDAVPVVEESTTNPEVAQYYLNENKKDCIAAFRFYKENGHLPKFSPIGEMICYETLAQAGLAPEIEITLDEQKAVLQRCINEFARNGMVSDMRRLEQAGPEATEIQYKAFALARRKALKTIFEKMVAEGVEITDYIKLK